MQKLSELLNIKIVERNPLKIYHPIFKDKIIYFENSNGYWYKYEYDSNGNIVYHENSDGDWFKCEFDSNGNCISFKDSPGYWFKAEYDSNNKEIYYENSDRIKRVTELTLDQIAEKFGISVNQLKIKK